ncbi:MAG: radical SAM protein [Bdellovibrionota bacterium]
MNSIPFSELFSTKESFPLLCQWELTCRCNLKCIMCYTDCANTREQSAQELSTEEIFRIMDEINEAGCLEIVFTGGEPLSRQDFLEIYKHAYSSGFLITVYTNGTLITHELADYFMNHRPKCVEISMHGVSDRIFDGVTQVNGSLSRCKSGIKLLLERGIPITLKTIGLTTNFDEILETKHYAKTLGTGVIWKFGQYLRNDLNCTDLPYRYQIGEPELRKLMYNDTELWKAKCDELENNCQAKQKCGGGTTKFHIDANGQLQLCSGNRIRSHDLKNSGSFKHAFYELMPYFPCPKRPGFPKNNCQNCKSKEHCL